MKKAIGDTMGGGPPGGVTAGCLAARGKKLLRDPPEKGVLCPSTVLYSLTSQRTTVILSYPPADLAC